jgi:hypothetical protein
VRLADGKLEEAVLSEEEAAAIAAPLPHDRYIIIIAGGR